MQAAADLMMKTKDAQPKILSLKTGNDSSL
jgi:hypothetical protein